MKRSKPSRTIAFRLPAALEERLIEQAAEAGRSSHIHARELVVAGLRQHDGPLEAATETITAEVRRASAAIRDDLATILESLLINLGVPEDDIRTFVSKKLRDPC